MGGARGDWKRMALMAARVGSTEKERGTKLVKKP
jgi:hypothetical protein